MRKVLLLIPAPLLFLFYMSSSLSVSPLPSGVTVDKLVVKKGERKLEAYSKGKVLKTYTISLGKQPVGDKQYEGDNKTPEGRYTIHDKNPHSGYYKNLGVSYPNAADKEEARRLNKPVGGDIKIHGLPNKLPFIGKWHRFRDWTAGCIALTNDEMEELYLAVPVGTVIEILP